MAIQFTEAEMLIMSSLAYTDIPKEKFDENGKPIFGPLSVSEILDGLDTLAKGNDYYNCNMNNLDRKSYEEAIISLKNKLEENDFVITKSINHNSSSESGFSAFAIEPRDNPEGEVVICCRGSDAMNLNPLDKGNTLNDWVGADLSLAWDEQTTQQEEMKLFMESYKNYHNITITGHSLGGNLAMYAAVTWPYPEKIAAVYAYDGPGFNQAFMSEHNEQITRMNEKIYNFQQEHDLVSSSLISIGNVIILDTTIEYNGGIDFEHHNRWAIAVKPDGSLRRNEIQEKDTVCKVWNGASNGISNVVNVKDVIFSGIISYATLFCKKASKVVSDFLNKNFNNGYKYSTANTYICLNTASLRSYASRLQKVNNRIANLDRRLDSLYTKVGLFDVWDLLQADMITGYSWRLNRAINYLNDTARDFEAAEHSIASQI